MNDTFLYKLKKMIPHKIFKRLQPFYHWGLAKVAPFIYGNPSNCLIVIGITGTKGKSSTSYILARILEQAGFKVGMSSGIIFKVSDSEWLNDYKMTMPGRFVQQKLLSDMAKAGCQYAIVETTSEGIKQYRHLGINYDVAVFTNLYPEHIESHGTYENYKKAKGLLFKHLTARRKKKQLRKKINIANADDKEYGYFSSFKADEHYSFGIENSDAQLKAEAISYTDTGTTFILGDVSFETHLLGTMNVYNVLAAVTVAKSLGVTLRTCADAVKSIDTIPGRLEFITEGQDFSVVVDYAHEPESLKQILNILKNSKKSESSLIHVFGATGGGRDKGKREEMGKISDTYADYIILTNDDPYEDDEQMIINDIAKGITKTENKSIIDREVAIKYALEKAKTGDIVLISGKGSEQAIVLNNGKQKWDDREKVRSILKNCSK